MELYPFQKEIVKSALKRDENLIISSPTGSGKTIIAKSMIDELVLKGNIITYVTPYLSILDQTIEKFGGRDKCGIIQDTNIDTSKNIIVCSKKTLFNHPEYIPTGTIMFIDECHRSLHSSHEIMEKCKPKQIYGLTATPERMDGASLIRGEMAIGKYTDAVFDDMIQRTTIPQLIEGGYLSPLRYFAKPIIGITDIEYGVVQPELKEKKMDEICEEYKIYSEVVPTYLEYGREKDGRLRPALIFCASIALCYKVAEIFNRAGLKFEVLTGNDDLDRRRELKNKLVNRDINGIVSVDVICEGFDCPEASYGALIRHIRSRPKWIQICGRLLRQCPGKEDCIIVDHTDTIAEFRTPYCNIDLLDPNIKYAVYGENAEFRKQRRNEERKFRRAIDKLYEICEIPCKMEEIKLEKNFEFVFNMVNKITKETYHLKSRKEELEVKEELLNKKIIDITSEKENVEKELKEMLKEKNEKENLINGLENDIKKVQKELSYSYVNQRKQEENHKFEINEKDVKIEELNKKILYFDNLIRDYSNKNKSLNIQINDLNQKIIDLKNIKEKKDNINNENLYDHHRYKLVKDEYDDMTLDLGGDTNSFF